MLLAAAASRPSCLAHSHMAARASAAAEHSHLLAATAAAGDDPSHLPAAIVFRRGKAWVNWTSAFAEALPAVKELWWVAWPRCFCY